MEDYRTIPSPMYRNIDRVSDRIGVIQVVILCILILVMKYLPRVIAGLSRACNEM